MKNSLAVLPLLGLLHAGLPVLSSAGQVPNPESGYTPEIPKTWDDAAMASLEVPLAHTLASPKHISEKEYYSLPVRAIHRTYPLYHPDMEPPAYRERLRQAKPEILWNDRGIRPPLRTKADWIMAGELVFHSPILFFPLGTNLEAERDFYRRTGDPVTRNGISPFVQLVIREPGKIEAGVSSCADCHTRVMPDGSLIVGAQGNRPLDRVIYFNADELEQKATNRAEFVRDFHENERSLYAAPWLKSDPNTRLAEMSVAEIAAVHMAIPAGALARQGASPFAPPQVPDLIGIQGRHYLDNTALVRHRGPGDLMRYAALNQGADLLPHFGEFSPASVTNFAALAPFARERYSDEQLFALALYIYSLKPPKNPNLPKSIEARALVDRGRDVFEREDCARCHTPPVYTNNKLTPARGFKVPENHPERTNIMSRSVGTDPALATTTRRGTGFYKVPSLLGVWYRGPFEHNGSCATLEDWFNPVRTNENYVPTGWGGPPHTKTRAVKGHEYGLDLSEDDRKALIAFLKTL